METNTIAKDAVIDVAEHPIKYSLQNIKTFGNDALNNMAVKEAFEKMKENMKATIKARQICIDNEYAYRTYKQQAIDGIKNTSTKIITPVRNVATQAVSGIMDGINLAYKNVLRDFAKSEARVAKFNFNITTAMYKVVEALSLGSFSNGTDVFHLKERLIASHEKEIIKLENKLVNAKGFRKEYLESLLKLHKDKTDYLTDNQMEIDVWKDKQSPEKYFQTEIIPEIHEYKNTFKEEAIKLGEKIKTIPAKTLDFIRNLGTKIKDEVIKKAETIANAVISIHDKASEKIADGSLKLAELVTDTSRTVNRKMITAQMAAKSSKEELEAKVENIKDTNALLLGIKNGGINADEYISEATKSMQADIEAIDKMHNPELAKYAALKLENAMNKDKKGLVKSLKKDKRKEYIPVAGKKINKDINKASSALYEVQNNLLGKLNNILVMTGEKALNDKIGHVSFNKSNTKEAENQLDEIKDGIDLG